MQCLFFSDTVMIKRYYTEILSKNYCLYMSNSNYIILFERGRRGRDRLEVGFTTTCVISAYYHLSCEFEPLSRQIQHYVIRFVSDLQKVGDFLQVEYLNQ